MGITVPGKPTTIKEFVTAIDLVVPPAQQAALFWPHSLDDVRISEDSLDDVGDSDHPLREVHAAFLFEAVDRIRRRVELGFLKPEFTAVANRLEAAIMQELDVSRDAVSSLIVTAADELLAQAPSVDPIGDVVGVEGEAVRNVL